MNDTSGFYKFDSVLMYGKLITAPEFVLIEAEHAQYQYPVDGWYWFDTQEEAKTFFNIVEPPAEGPINNRLQKR